MPTLQERLETSTAQLETDSGLLHNMVHGSDTTTVTTEGGDVPAFAKVVADLIAQWGAEAVVATVYGYVNDAYWHRQAAEAAASTCTALVSSLPKDDLVTVSANTTMASDANGRWYAALTAAAAVQLTTPVSDDAATGNVDAPFSLWVSCTGGNALTVVTDGTDTIGGGSSLVLADGDGARLVLDESVTPHNWRVQTFGASPNYLRVSSLLAEIEALGAAAQAAALANLGAAAASDVTAINARLNADRIFRCSDQKSSGTGGGSSSTGSWVIRTLNTPDEPASWASLSGNVVTINSPGVYRVWASAPGYGVLSHQVRLYDVTNSVELAVGTSESSSSNNVTSSRSFVEKKVTVTSSLQIRLEHRFGNTLASIGMGPPCSFGVNEKYAILGIDRLS